MKIPSKYTDFILNYNETFKYIEKEYSRETVDDYWQYLSMYFLKELDNLIKDFGINGMKKYWGKTLPREKAPYRLKISDDGKQFEMTMVDWKDCPPIKVIRENKVRMWHSYCDHCEGIYKPVAENNGFDFRMNYEGESCSFVISKKDI